MVENNNEIDPFGFNSASFAGPMGMNEQIAHMIIGAVVTTTRAISKAEVKIDANIQRVFVSVTFRRWARIDRLKSLRSIWLKRAEERAQGFIPQGWRLLAYEVKNEEEG